MEQEIQALEAVTPAAVPTRKRVSVLNKLKDPEQTIPEIRSLAKSGVKQSEIAVKFGVSTATISKIINGKLYGWCE